MTSYIIEGPPDQPTPVRALGGTSTSLMLGWESPSANGAAVSEFALEMDTGNNSGFRRVYVGSDTEFEVSKLKKVTG